MPGVRHVVLSPSRSRRLVGDGAGTSLDRAVEMGRQALQAFRLLRQSGFVPDMMLLSSALEQGLFLRDAFPDAFVACFAESLPSDGLAGDGKGLVRPLAAMPPDAAERSGHQAWRQKRKTAIRNSEAS